MKAEHFSILHFCAQWETKLNVSLIPTTLYSLYFSAHKTSLILNSLCYKIAMNLPLCRRAKQHKRNVRAVAVNWKPIL